MELTQAQEKAHAELQSRLYAELDHAKRIAFAHRETGAAVHCPTWWRSDEGGKTFVRMLASRLEARVKAFQRGKERDAEAAAERQRLEQRKGRPV